MRVLLTGGGTAGHINPALAIAETIRQNDPDAVIEFVGIKNGKENDLVPREGYRLHHVKSMGIRRSLSPSNIKALWLALTSPYSKETVGIIKDFHPDVVIGTGGYACWPIMAAAARLGIPTAVHESNALPGLAVKRLQNKVDRIWINFHATKDLIRRQDKVVRVGNPLRGGFGLLSKEAARNKLGIAKDQVLVLSFGGSLGAEEVNTAAIGVMKELISSNPRLLHVHATGKRDFEAAKKQFEDAGLSKRENCVLTDYIYDMPTYMAAADLVISRAGAMTLSELALMQKACILIPSPYVADNHQYKNAKTLSDACAAYLVEEHTLAGGELLRVAKMLLETPEERAILSYNVQKFADTDANRRIWEEIKELTKTRKS